MIIFPKMAQLVVKMLKRRESLRQEAYTTLVSSSSRHYIYNHTLQVIHVKHLSIHL